MRDTICKIHPLCKAIFYCENHHQWICNSCLKLHRYCGNPIHYSQLLHDADQKKIAFQLPLHIVQVCLQSATTKINATYKEFSNLIQVFKQDLTKNMPQNLVDIIESSTTPLQQAIMLHNYTKHLMGSENEKLAELVSKFYEKINAVQNLLKLNTIQMIRGNLYNVDSKIITPSDFPLIAEWLQKPRVTLKYLYRASTDGFDSKDFHNKCDNFAPTIVFVQTTAGKIIGGYSTVPWKSSKEEMEFAVDKTNECFIFSLSLKQKCPLKTPEYAICFGKERGPTFGGGIDLEIVSNSNVNKNRYYYVGYSYDTKLSEYEFYGDKFYTIADYEVYEVS